MRKSVGTFVLLVVAVVLFNVWREGGPGAVRSWFKAKLLNKPDARPRRAA